MEYGVNTFAYYVIAQKPLFTVGQFKFAVPFFGKHEIYGNEYIGCLKWNAYNDQVAPQGGMSYKLAQDKVKQLESQGYIAQIKTPEIRISICP